MGRNKWFTFDSRTEIWKFLNWYHWIIFFWKKTCWSPTSFFQSPIQVYWIVLNTSTKIVSEGGVIKRDFFETSKNWGQPRIPPFKGRKRYPSPHPLSVPFFHMKEIWFILSSLNLTGDTLSNYSLQRYVGLRRLLFRILIFTKAAKKELPPRPSPAEKNPNNWR